MAAAVGVEPRYFSRFLDDTGYGGGVTAAIGNYSAAKKDFKISPRPGNVFRIRRAVITIGDETVSVQDGYGGGSALTNGVRFFVKSNRNPTLWLDDGQPIKTNSNWVARTHNVGVGYAETAGNRKILRLLWDFVGSGGVPIRLNGTYGESLIIRLNDDFTFLTKHHYIVQGYQETEFWS